MCRSFNEQPAQRRGPFTTLLTSSSLNLRGLNPQLAVLFGHGADHSRTFHLFAAAKTFVVLFGGAFIVEEVVHGLVAFLHLKALLRLRPP